MKKLMSLFLAFACVLAMVPLQGVAAEVSSINEEMLFVKQSDEKLETALISDEGDIIVSWCEYSNPDVVYEVTIANGVEALDEYDISEDAVWDIVDSYAVKNSANIQGFCTASNKENVAQPYSLNDNATVLKKNTIRKLLEEEHDKEDEHYWLCISTSTQYSPVTLRVRETLLFAITGGSTKSFSAGMKVITAATNLATILGINVNHCVEVILAIADLASSSDVLADQVEVETYYAAANYHRHGTVQASSSAQEMMYDAAAVTERYGYVAIIDGTKIDENTTDYADITYLKPEEPMITYSNNNPSSFATDALLAAAYQAYLDS